MDRVMTWEQFRRTWSGLQNFAVGGEVFPHRFTSPPPEDVVDAIRKDETARIWRGHQGTRLDKIDIATEFRSLPIAEAVKAKVQMSHFDLSRFTGEGQIFAGLNDMLQQWQNALSQHGFSWSRLYPIVFLSGPHCYTNYHFDPSHVLVWQIAGTKRFCWLKDPERWCPHEERKNVQIPEKMVRPAGLTVDDIIEIEMHPGDVLWNTVLTPHWVYSAEETAYNINIALHDLRCDGQLSPLGTELEAIMRERETAAVERT